MQCVVTTRNSNLNVRSGTSDRFPVIAQLAKGTRVEVAQVQNGWARITHPRQGWVLASLLSPNPDQQAGSPVTTVPQTRSTETAPGVPDPLRPASPAPLLAARGINWINLWNNYPIVAPAAVKRTIGGAVDADWITNTCVVRLSRALNYGGALVPRNFPGLHTVRGRDRLNYAFRVREMRAYLQHRFGSPTIRAASDRHQAVTNHRGIIVFDVRVWSDATGHIDLWDGLNIRHCAYFEEASEVLLWEIP